MDNFISAHILALTLSISTPLFIAALGALLNERVGVVNVGLEGIMLSGAFSAAVMTYFTHSPWLGVLAAVLTGVALGALHAAVCVGMRTDHVVSGVAINILAGSATIFLLQFIFHNKGQTPNVESIGTLGDSLRGIPLVGPVFDNMSHLTILGILLVVCAHFVLRYTKIGLRLRSVGENPHAAMSLGIPVRTYMILGVIVGCALVGLAGAYLSIGILNVFTKNMSAGRGFIALAIMILGRWSPFGALWASLFFGYVMALQSNTQGLPVPSQLIEVLPYAITLIVLVFTYKNVKGPAHAGRIFAKK